MDLIRNYKKEDLTQLLSKPVTNPIWVYEEQIQRFSGNSERVMIQSYPSTLVPNTSTLFTTPTSYLFDLDKMTYIMLTDLSSLTSKTVVCIYSVTKTGYQSNPHKIELVYSSYAPTLIANRGDKFHFANWYFSYPSSVSLTDPRQSNQWGWIQSYLESNLCFYTLEGNVTDNSIILMSNIIQDQ